MPCLLALVYPDLDFNAFSNAVKKVSMSETKLAVTYEWQADLADKLRAVLIPREEQARLRIYQERLVEVSQALPAKNMSMT